MRTPHRASRGLTVAAWLLVAAPTTAAGESFRYQWSLDGFVGALASLFVPSRGEGLLTYEPLAGGRERGELLVTSKQSGAEEYFRYGSVWDPAARRTIEASSDLVWSGETKSKRSALDGAQVLDIVAAIQLLRREPPDSARRLEIWSDGRLYAVVVVPRERAKRRRAGAEVAARHYSVHGVPVPERKLWKGNLDLWIAEDDAATPIEIVVSRSGARVRLVLVESSLPAETEPPGDPR
jgi:hypothetical protein